MPIVAARGGHDPSFLIEDPVERDFGVGQGVSIVSSKLITEGMQLESLVGKPFAPLIDKYRGRFMQLSRQRARRVINFHGGAPRCFVHVPEGS